MFRPRRAAAWATKLRNLSLPRRLARNHRPHTGEGLRSLEAALREHYFDRSSPYLQTAAGRRDLENHLTRRLDHDRRVVVPWLDRAQPLAGARVLEIGSGTGCSTIALAEQGAQVVGIDVDEPALQVARRRSEVYGVAAELHAANAVEAGRILAGRQFDLVIFYASLEHMTYEERLAAIATTWEMLPPGAFWAVVETPNRLWFRDHHTSLLPFYHWLPDELAMPYAQFSPRAGFRERYDRYDPAAAVEFLRRGRGASVHEFQLALGTKLNVVSYQRPCGRLGGEIERWLPFRSTPAAYRAVLRRIQPDLHPAWLQKELNLILRK